ASSKSGSVRDSEVWALFHRQPPSERTATTRQSRRRMSRHTRAVLERSKGLASEQHHGAQGSARKNKKPVTKQPQPVHARFFDAGFHAVHERHPDEPERYGRQNDHLL